MSNYHKVKAFHAAILDTPPLTPTATVSPQTLDLRKTLIQEEYQEAQEALKQLQSQPTEQNLAHVAHELADLLYVTYGSFIALGIDADAVFAEVHQANMNKTTGKRREDGKQLKPEGWQPANVLKVIQDLKSATQFTGIQSIQSDQ